VPPSAVPFLHNFSASVSGPWTATCSGLQHTGRSCWHAFDGTDYPGLTLGAAPREWLSRGYYLGPESRAPGAYAGPATTTSTSGERLAGEWLQLRRLDGWPVRLTHFTLAGYLPGAARPPWRGGAPRRFYLAATNQASDDGQWTVLYETPRGGQEDAWGYQSRRNYVLSAPSDYLAYRWIFAELYPYYNRTGRGATPVWSNATAYSGSDQEWSLAASSYITNAQHVWRAFNGRADVSTDYWSSTAGTYQLPGGLPAAGAAVTYNVDGAGSVVGEWLQVSHAQSRWRVASFTLTARHTYSNESPRTFRLLGGQGGGGGWTTLYTQSSPLTTTYWADPNRARTFTVGGTAGFYTSFRLVVLETLSSYGNAVIGDLSFVFDELALRNQPGGYSDPGSVAQLLAPLWSHKAGYTGQDADVRLSSSSSLGVDQDVWYAFNGAAQASTDYWSSSAAELYNSSLSGVSLSNISNTSRIDGTQTWRGAWVQAEYRRSARRPVQFRPLPRYGLAQNSPKTIGLLGSLDGGQSWTSLYQHLSFVDDVTRPFTLAPGLAAYPWLRFVARTTRVDSLGGNSVAPAELGELWLEFEGPDGWSRSCSGLSVSSQYGLHDVKLAFNGLAATAGDFWSSGQGYLASGLVNQSAAAQTPSVDGTTTVWGEWVQLTHSTTARRVRSLYLTARSTYFSEAPRRFRLLGSQDGASWTTVYHADPVPTTPAWGSGAAQTKQFDVPASAGAYRSYRFVVTETGQAYGAAIIGDLALDFEDPRAPWPVPNASDGWSVDASSLLVEAGFDHGAWRAFNGLANAQEDYWCSRPGTYYGNGTANPGSAASTPNVDGATTLYGEWLQLAHSAKPRRLVSLTLTARFQYSSESGPRKFRLLGSNDSLAWQTLLEQATALTWTSGTDQTKTWAVPAAGAGRWVHSVFRLVVTESTNPYGTAQVGELSLAFEEAELSAEAPELYPEFVQGNPGPCGPALGRRCEPQAGGFACPCAAGFGATAAGGCADTDECTFRRDPVPQPNRAFTLTDRNNMLCRASSFVGNDGCEQVFKAQPNPLGGVWTSGAEFGAANGTCTASCGTNSNPPGAWLTVNLGAVYRLRAVGLRPAAGNAQDTAPLNMSVYASPYAMSLYASYWGSLRKHDWLNAAEPGLVWFELPLRPAQLVMLVVHSVGNPANNTAQRASVRLNQLSFDTADSLVPLQPWSAADVGVRVAVSSQHAAYPSCTAAKTFDYETATDCSAWYSSSGGYDPATGRYVGAYGRTIGGWAFPGEHVTYDLGTAYTLTRVALSVRSDAHVSGPNNLTLGISNQSLDGPFVLWQTGVFFPWQADQHGRAWWFDPGHVVTGRFVTMVAEQVGNGTQGSDALALHELFFDTAGVSAGDCGGSAMLCDNQPGTYACRPG